MCYVFSVIVFETGHGGRRLIVVLSVLRYTALLLKGRFLRKINRVVNLRKQITYKLKANLLKQMN